jgi:hypothetical protein
MVEIRQQEAEEQAEAFIDAELDGCDEFDVDASEDTSGHEYQLGSGLNNLCVGCEDCDCKSKPKFKVGDVVRVISTENGGEDDIGHKDIIAYIDGESYYLQSGWGISCGSRYGPEELELVE